MPNRPTYPSLRGVLRDLVTFKNVWEIGIESPEFLTQDEIEIAAWLADLATWIQTLEKSDGATK